MSLVIDLFRKYIAIPSASREDTGLKPSTKEQLNMAAALEKDMREMGLSDIKNPGNGYVYGRVPANAPDQPAIGLIAHLDVVDNEPCAPMNERIIEHYDGGVICPGEDVTLDPALYPHLKTWIGKDLIVTDGKTILGADDKAGVAEIMALAHRLLNDQSIKHGDVMVCFTPDEEIGGGADDLDIPGFGAEFAYTVDGGELGGVEYENFNAASARVSFKGVSIHPGDAKGRMKNAALMAAEFAFLLPQAETPAHTEGREGFYHLVAISGTPEQAEVAYILRDHDLGKLEEKKEYLRACEALMKKRYGEECCSLSLRDAYRNMADIIKRHPAIITRAQEAFRACGVEPFSNPVRGGTDGANLSFRGLPCPNLSTGSINHHGRGEIACVQDMEKMVDVLTEIVRAR
ncbi:MAG: peptidase T [Clostridia bacterium]|nr:peptidase T [Clostridia bacterium]